MHLFQILQEKALLLQLLNAAYFWILNFYPQGFLLQMQENKMQKLIVAERINYKFDLSHSFASKGFKRS